MAEAGLERGWRARVGIRRWLAGLSVYREPRLVAILLMGFSSGLPLALTGASREPHRCAPGRAEP